MRAGLALFDTLDLPHGGDALGKIRQGLAELDVHIQEAIKYQQLCPKSAPLLQVQVCSAAGDEDPPEWSMGRLFTSQDVLLFESFEQPPWTIGPLKWLDISSLHKLQESAGGDIRLASSSGAVHFFCRLEQLGSA
jgi:hypothetical protein